MTPRWLRSPAASLFVLVLFEMVATGPAGAQPAGGEAPRRERASYVGGVRDTGQFLPDTAVILRVGPRVTRVSRFVELYFGSDARFRPAPDSLGRLEFLNSLVNREILALTALAANRALTFEDRTILREHRERVLSNAAFHRLVTDSIRISEDDLRRVYEEYRYDQRLRLIRFADREVAERTRAALIGKRLSWPEAARRHHRPLPGEPADGEVGWFPRHLLDAATASGVYRLKPGEISEILPEPAGYRLFQAVERRKAEPPAYVGVRRLLFMNLRTQLATIRASKVQAELARDLGIEHDSTNIAWAVPHFSNTPLVESGASGEVVLNLDRAVPTFSAEDAERVLARHRDGRFTLGDFVHAYSAISGPLRPVVGDPDAFREFVNLMVLQPSMARLAEQRGFDRDSATMAQLAEREERLRVEHLYADSISSKVWIDSRERRAFYEQNMQQLVTYPLVRFAAIVRFTQAGAESLSARLRAGTRPHEVLRADSLQGLISGSIQERRQNEHGPYHKILFEELRPGDVRVTGPDGSGHWLVIQLLEFDPGRQLSYAEADHIIDDVLRDRKSEELLEALVARHRARYPVESHPEWVMRIRLVEPTSTGMEPTTDR